MKINFQDYGAVASVTITSTIFELRKHNRIVDTVLFLVPEVTSAHRGFFLIKTTISGKNIHVLRAHTIALREAAR